MTHANTNSDPYDYLLSQVQLAFNEHFPRCVSATHASERPAPANDPVPLTERAPAASSSKAPQ